MDKEKNKQNETIEALDLDLIAKSYDYTPVITRELFPLNLDWSEAMQNIDLELKESVHSISEGKAPTTEPSRTMRYFQVLNKEIPCPYGKVRLEMTEAVPLTRYGKHAVNIQLYFNDEIIGDFSLYPSWGTWDIKHRVIRPEFRGQGIGTKMTKILESYVQAKADQEANNQEIVISVGQVDVLNFYQKNGYEVLPEDIEKYNRIAQCDPTLCLINDTILDRNMFVFERNKLPESEEDFDEHQALSIRLRKKIAPKNLDTHRGETSEKISDLFRRI